MFVLCFVLLCCVVLCCTVLGSVVLCCTALGSAVLLLLLLLFVMLSSFTKCEKNLQGTLEMDVHNIGLAMLVIHARRAFVRVDV